MCYTAVASIGMACVVMAMLQLCLSLYGYGLNSYVLYSRRLNWYGLYSHGHAATPFKLIWVRPKQLCAYRYGLNSYGLYKYGLNRYGLYRYGHAATLFEPIYLLHK